MAKAAQHTPEYQNNPFFVATNGLTLLFNKAMSVAILAIVLASLGLMGNAVKNVTNISMHDETFTQSSQSADKTTEHAFNNFVGSLTTSEITILVTIGVIVLLTAIFVSTMIVGVFDYTAAQLARGKTVTLQEAIQAVLHRFFGYLWLTILVGIKILLWTLLLVVPGIIMAVRYSLSGVAFFEKDLSANAASKESSRLVKGAWITTFGSLGLFNIITFGMIQTVLQPGTNAILYRQFKAYDTAKTKKPAAHALSWLTLLLPLGLVILTMLVGGAVAYVVYLQSR